MKIPNQVRVGPHIYKVVFATSIPGENGQILYGQSRHWEKQILIDKTRGQTIQEETFVHELIHCIAAIYAPTQEELQEKEVERLGVALYQLIKDNKGIFTW